MAPGTDNRPAEEIPPTCVHPAFLLETLLQATHWARHKGHRHHHVSPLVPEELVLPHAVLSALYVVTCLILAKAPEGTLTLPILQMGKLSPRAVEVTCPRLRGLVSGRAAWLACFIYGTVNIPRSGLSVVHRGTGLSTKEFSGKCWQMYEHEHESQKGAQARLRTELLHCT